MNENKIEGAERRRFPRLDMRVKVEYRVLTHLTKKNFVETAIKERINSVTRNITPLGLCIPTTKVVPQDTVLELLIKFPEAEIKALSRVVWSKQLEKEGKIFTGVEFIALKDKQMGILTQHIAEYFIKKYKMKEEEGKSIFRTIISNIFRKKSFLIY